ncbi:MAG TPA: SdrD B-like domain-containing protein, partial [Dermatophilaceae bacterium]|nr:SdrD B-like domain-containing protein [Dermatophilaceae bacterium]
MAGVTVNLLDEAGNPAVLPGGAPVTTTTDANGFYSFTNLLAGVTYQVEFVKPADTIFTTQDVAGVTSNDPAQDGTDSDADTTTGRVTVVAPATGTNSATAPDNPSIDAGLVELVSIGDVVWWDSDRDGVQDAGELPVSGVVVNLLNPDGSAAVLPGGAPVTATTDANGFYAFTNLLAGVTYQVQFVKPGNTIFTSQDATGVTSNDPATDGTDSDADEATGLVTVTAPITGANSATAPDNPSIDAGLVKLVSVGDYVWWDTNLDGIQGDPAIEKPVAGVTVRLLDAAGDLAVLPGGAPVTTVTDANGYYAFTNLIGGVDYIVEFVKPAETIYTIANAGSDISNSATTDVTDSDADEVTG